jgi:hypothetical protein
MSVRSQLQYRLRDDPHSEWRFHSLIDPGEGKILAAYQSVVFSYRLVAPESKEWLSRPAVEQYEPTP